MNTADITTPQQLGKVLKDIFKEKFGIEIRTRYIKTVRGLDYSWYEISTFRTGQAIFPNDFRKRCVELNYNKPFSECNVQNPDDISYGNTQKHCVALHGKRWKQWIDELVTK